MSATALLLLLIAVFVILNAGNFTQVILGNAQISFLGKGARTSQVGPSRTTTVST